MPQTYRVTLSDGRVFNVTTEGGPPSEADVLGGLGAETPKPDFQTTNEKDANGQAVVSHPHTRLGRVLGHAWDAANPLEAAKALGRTVIPEAGARLMGAGDEEASQYGPVNNIINPMRATFDAARAAWQRGDYGNAAIKFAFSGIPMVGPAFSQMGDEMGTDPEKAIGNALGMGASMVAPNLVKGATAKIGPVKQMTQNPMEAAAVEFGRAEGIPLDAGTVTGSQFVKNVQKKVGGTWGGANTVENFQRAQGEALAAAGERQMAAVNPRAVGPVAAGEGVTQALEGRIVKYHGEASAAYEKLRQFEQAAPDEPVPVRSEPVPTDPGVLDQRFVLRWLADDLAEMPYQSSSRMRGQQLADTMTDATSQEAGRRAAYSPRVAGSPVQDTLNMAGLSGTKAELSARINQALQTGKIDPKLGAVADAYREAWDGQGFDFDLVSPETLAKAGVMRKGLKSPITMPDVTEPGAWSFFPDSSIPEAPKPSVVANQKLAVDLRQSKQSLAPIYDRLKREADLVPLQGGKARALTALDRLMAGPDFAPLSVVDEALGDLKSLARTDDLPELRTQGQGVAALAVKELDAQVRARAAQAGPEVLRALEDGRTATVAKYLTRDARDLMGAAGEPLGVFKRLTAAKDGGITKLRELKIMAPKEVPNVARAVLEDILEKPTSEGGFKFADGAIASWRKLGPETKKLLFTKPGQIEALDNFFLLAKKIGENPNPSGTAQTLNATNVLLGLPAYAIARLLYTDRGVRALTRAAAVKVNAAPAAQALAVAQLSRAAQEAGVIVAFPKAADGQPDRKPQ